MPSYSLAYVDFGTTAPPPADDPIAARVNGCGCARCVGLEVCPSCGQRKLDADWCFSCGRLVFFYEGQTAGQQGVGAAA
jgi:hypothetical protein